MDGWMGGPTYMHKYKYCPHGQAARKWSTACLLPDENHTDCGQQHYAITGGPCREVSCSSCMYKTDTVVHHEQPIISCDVIYFLCPTLSPHRQRGRDRETERWRERERGIERETRADHLLPAKSCKKRAKTTSTNPWWWFNQINI